MSSRTRVRSRGGVGSGLRVRVGFRARVRVRGALHLELGDAHDRGGLDLDAVDHCVLGPGGEQQQTRLVRVDAPGQGGPG